MSWTQVYITGLPRSVEPSDEEIESFLVDKYNLDNDQSLLLWAGRGSTLIKRDEKSGFCRGYGFITFYSKDGASTIVDRINNNNNNNNCISSDYNGELTLRAELSNPKSKEKKKKKTSSSEAPSAYGPDLRLRRQRKAPIRKHPVIVSSNGKKTNLGNKTR